MLDVSSSSWRNGVVTSSIILIAAIEQTEERLVELGKIFLSENVESVENVFRT